MKNVYEIEFEAKDGRRGEWRRKLNEKIWVSSSNGPVTAIRKAERRYRYFDAPIRVVSCQIVGTIDVG